MAPSAGRKRKVTPRSAAEWAAVLPQYIGMFGLVLMLIFWGVTYLTTGRGAFEPAMLTAFGGLIVVGQGTEAVVKLKRPPDGGTLRPTDSGPDPDRGDESE